MKVRFLAVAVVAFFAFAAIGYAAMTRFQVKPGEFEPEKTPLVNGAWLNGLGCPTNAKTAQFGPPPNFPIEPGPPYTEPVCATGDSKDKKKNEGLLLVKTGPTTNAAAAGAEIKKVKGETLNELGYDLRKPSSTGDARGSHCGAGAPRFNVIVKSGSTEQFFFIGCNSPPPSGQTGSGGWLRLRWGDGSNPLAAYPASGICSVGTPLPGGQCNIKGLEIRFLEIVMDEGQDTGPDNSGLAVLDNVDVNTILVGQGPTDAD